MRFLPLFPSAAWAAGGLVPERSVPAAQGSSFTRATVAATIASAVVNRAR